MLKALQVACLKGKCIKTPSKVVSKSIPTSMNKQSKFHARTHDAKIRKWRYEWKRKGNHKSAKGNKHKREKRLESRHLGGEAKGCKRTKKPGSPGKTALN